AHVLPGLAAVGGLVDAVAVGDAVARVVLAGAHPDDVPVRRRDGHGADGDGALVVELVLEGGAVIAGLEEAAGGGGDPVGTRVGVEDADGGDAAAHGRRADAAPGELLQPGRLGVALDAAGRGRLRLLAQLVELLGEFLDLFFDLGDLLFAGQFLA